MNINILYVLYVLCFLIMETSMLIFSVVITRTVYYFFWFFIPTKCEKCGKFLAFISWRRERTRVCVEEQYFVVTAKDFYRRKCLSCGHKGAEQFDEVQVDVLTKPELNQLRKNRQKTRG